MNSEAHARDGANKVLVLLGFGQQKDSLCLLCALQLLCFRPAGILIMEGGGQNGEEWMVVQSIIVLMLVY